MRILHIVGTMDPAAGGPTEAIRMLVRHQPEGYRAEIATLDAPEAGFLAELASAGLVVHALGAPGSRGVGRNRWYSARMGTWLRANRGRFDGALVHGLWEYTGLAARLNLTGFGSLLGATGARLPYAIFPHGMLDPYFRRAAPFKHLKKALYWLLVEFWNLRKANFTLFTTSMEARLARQSFWPAVWRPRVTALGAESPPADEPTLLAAFQERCPELRSRRFLLFLGRIDPKKGCDLLVRAFAQVCAEDPERTHDLHLVMAGPDPAGWGPRLCDRADTEAAVAERVHWPGMLTGPAKWGAFAACEAFVLPSHQENFGIAVVEALASGRGVLISDQVNLAADLAADGCGLVEADTLAGTAQLLRRWLALDSEAREAMERQARLSFRARYSMERNAARVLQLFAPATAADAAAATPASDTPVPEAR